MCGCFLSLSGEMKFHADFYVLTGGPGAGKTCLLKELESRGYRCRDEVAREIIREQVASGGNAVPWGNVPKYTELMLQRSVEDYICAELSGGMYIFDRGIPDTFAYARLTGWSFEPEVLEQAKLYGYNRTVFLLPPWEEIYRQDGERKQDYREAVDTYEEIRCLYGQWGYHIVLVPKLSVQERADYVEKYIRVMS